jgi:hypothetical protein
MWSFWVIRQENVLKRQGAKNLPFFGRLIPRPGRAWSVSRLENSRCAICVKPSAMDSQRVDKHKENRAELKERKLLFFS